MSRIKERRQAKRVSLRLEVCYQSEAGKASGQTLDASTRGFFVKTDQPLPIGTTIPFKLTHKEMAGVFEVVGRVAHILPKSEQHGAGMGVEIKTLSAGQDERFDEYRSMVEKALFKMK